MVEPGWVDEVIRQLPPLLSEAHAANALGIKRSTLRNWRSAGRIEEWTRVGRAVRIPRTEIRRLILEGLHG